MLEAVFQFNEFECDCVISFFLSLFAFTIANNKCIIPVNGMGSLTCFRFEILNSVIKYRATDGCTNPSIQ